MDDPFKDLRNQREADEERQKLQVVLMAQHDEMVRSVLSKFYSALRSEGAAEIKPGRPGKWTMLCGRVKIFQYHQHLIFTVEIDQETPSSQPFFRVSKVAAKDAWGVPHLAESSVTTQDDSQSDLVSALIMLNKEDWNTYKYLHPREY